jgi:GAF domain
VGDEGVVEDGESSLILSEPQREALRAMLHDGAFADDDLAPLTSVAALIEEAQSRRALMAVLNRFKLFAEEAQDTIDERLYTLATTIANDHLADVAWLFIKREHGIEAIFAHKNRDRDEFLGFDQPSLAGYVAQSGTPIAAPDVYDRTKVPAYRCFPDMKSAISVPLKITSGEVLGVFHLESTEQGEYQDEHIAELQAAAAELIPFLLMLRALECDDDRWFPWRSFDLTLQLSTLCHDIRRALDRTGIQCAIGCADHESKYIFVYTTTGHASEYMYSKTLPFTSFNGDLLRMPPNATGTIRPGEKTRIETATEGGLEIQEGHLPFIETWKGSFAKWHMSRGTSLYVRMPGEDTASAQGTIVLACFDDEGERALPHRDELVQIADEMGEFITGYVALGEELAVAYLHQALHACLRTEDAFEVIVQKFTEFFSLKACALDGYLKGDGSGEHLTRHLTRGGFGRAVELVRTLANNPFHALRPDTFDDEGNRIGTIHLVRSRPFTVSERELAHRLTAMCASRFTEWQAKEERKATASVVL